MGGEKPEHEPLQGEPLAGLINAHGDVLGRVAMALLGDPAEVERALESAAQQAAGGRGVSEDVKPVAWLLGLVRDACAAQLTKLPLRSRSGAVDTPPTTERLGAKEALPARAALASLKPTEREAVVLCLVGGLEAADVASACNVDVATAKARIARGLEQLLASEGGTR
jgi:RNA polymerase sigma-70 factor (ECF subfamily)